MDGRLTTVRVYLSLFKAKMHVESETVRPLIFFDPMSTKRLTLRR